MTTEQKHTEGPWEARTFLVMGGKGMRDRICHVGTSTSLGPPRAYETEANARLIAAAPELLAALNNLAALAKDYLPDAEEPTLARAVIEADAAIAKATQS